MRVLDWRGVSRAEAEAAVAEQERAYASQMETVCRSLASAENMKYLLLSGPTCSGKTTTAGKLAEGFARLGRQVKVISIDDFYKLRKDLDLSDGRKVDFESVNTIDLPALREVIRCLQNGEPARLPQYDFNRRDRGGYENYLPGEKDLYIFEGIQAMYPEVIALFPAEQRRNLFVTVNEDLTVSGVLLDRVTVRLIRRIVRDFHFRSATPEFTLSLWDNVRANEIRNILPNAARMDVIVNTLLPYEAYVMAKQLTSLLEKADPASPYAAALQDLRKTVEPLLESPADAFIVPENSMLREFIG